MVVLEEAVIPPQTDGKLRLTIVDADGNPVTAAAVALVDVYDPKGQHVGVSVPLTYDSTLKVWTFDILATWSDASGKSLEGEFMVRMNMLVAGKKLGDRIRYVVAASDRD